MRGWGGKSGERSLMAIHGARHRIASTTIRAIDLLETKFPTVKPCVE
jgi:hypothetical protein